MRHPSPRVSTTGGKHILFRRSSLRDSLQPVLLQEDTGPTMWKEEELHRLDIGGSFVCSHASAWRAAVFCCGLGISPTVLNPLGTCLVALSGVPLGFLGASWALFGLSWRLLDLLEVN